MSCDSDSKFPPPVHAHTCTHTLTHTYVVVVYSLNAVNGHTHRETHSQTPKNTLTFTHNHNHCKKKKRTGRGTKGCVFSVVCVSASLCVYSLWPQVKAHAASFQRKVGVCVRKERMRGVEPRGGAIDFCLAHTLTSEYTRSH